MFGKPGRRQSANLALFVAVDRFGRTSEASISSSFDFDECNRVSLAHDEIEFSTATSPVLVEDDPTPLLVPAGCELFTLSPQLLPCMRHCSKSTDLV